MSGRSSVEVAENSSLSIKILLDLDWIDFLEHLGDIFLWEH